MGVIGEKLGSLLGRSIGNFAGSKLGKYTGIGAQEGGEAGGDIGGKIGALLPFKKGGRVKKTGPILAHKGEFILPRGVAPTKQQLKKVAMKHKKMGKKRVYKKRK